MHLDHPYFVFFNLFVWLLSGAVAAVPGTVYRGETRNAKAIKAAGGLKSKGSGHKLGPDGTLFQHISKSLKYPQRDPYVSTSIDYDAAKDQIHGNGYIYHIDTSGIENMIYNVAAEYEAADETYPYSYEKEFAVYGRYSLV